MILLPKGPEFAPAAGASTAKNRLKRRNRPLNRDFRPQSRGAGRTRRLEVPFSVKTAAGLAIPLPITASGASAAAPTARWQTSERKNPPSLSGSGSSPPPNRIYSGLRNSSQPTHPGGWAGSMQGARVSARSLWGYAGRVGDRGSDRAGRGRSPLRGGAGIWVLRSYQQFVVANYRADFL